MIIKLNYNYNSIWLQKKNRVAVADHKFKNSSCDLNISAIELVQIDAGFFKGSSLPTCLGRINIVSGF